MDSKSPLTNWVTCKFLEISHLLRQRRLIITSCFSAITSAAVMLGNEVLKSFIVYSSTKAALLGYG